MYRIKHFDLGTVALYSFIMTFVVMLLFMVPFGLFMSAMPDMGDQMFPFADLGFLFLILIALAYAVIITIIYTIIALFYNLLSTKLGGIKVSVEKVEDAPVIDQQVEGLSE